MKIAIISLVLFISQLSVALSERTVYEKLDGIPSQQQKQDLTQAMESRGFRSVLFKDGVVYYNVPSAIYYTPTMNFGGRSSSQSECLAIRDKFIQHATTTYIWSDCLKDDFWNDWSLNFFQDRRIKDKNVFPFNLVSVSQPSENYRTLAECQSNLSSTLNRIQSLLQNPPYSGTAKVVDGYCDIHFYVNVGEVGPRFQAIALTVN